MSEFELCRVERKVKKIHSYFKCKGHMFKIGDRVEIDGIVYSITTMYKDLFVDTEYHIYRLMKSHYQEAKGIKIR